MSLSFNGTTSVMSSGSAQLDANGPLTWCGWFAPDSLGEGGSGALITRTTTPGAAGRRFLRLMSTNAIQAHVDSWATSAVRRISAANAIRTDGSFQHIALTWNGTSDAAELRIYVNGVEPSYTVTGNGAGSFAAEPAGSTFNVGNTRNTAATFSGRIAHVMAFRRVLSQGEIQQVMQHPASIGAQGQITAGTGGLVGYWPMTEVSFVIGEQPIEISFGGNSGNDLSLTTVPVHYSNPPVNEPFVIGAPTQAWYMGG